MPLAAVIRASSVRNRSRATRARQAITETAAEEETLISTELSVVATPVVDTAVEVVATEVAVATE